MDTQPQGPRPHLARALIIVGFAVVVIAVAWFVAAQDSPAPTNSNTSSTTDYSSPALGFRATLPPGWRTLSESSFTADAVFQSPHALECGCAVYVALESNPTNLSIADWLDSATPKTGSYMTQTTYDQRKASSDPGTRAQAGLYSQSPGTLGGVSALVQEFQTEGGGYVRYLVLRERAVFSLTLWSDSYYFNDTAKQNEFDGGQLKRQADSLVGSVTFIE